MGAPAKPPAQGSSSHGHGDHHSFSWEDIKKQIKELKNVQLCPDPDTLIFFMLAVVFMTIAASVTLITCTTMELTAIGGVIAFLLVTLACGISAYDIHEHFTHWQKPYLQRYCVRILLMVPIYGIQSWCALIFHEKAFILESLREMYEAWVVYSFVYLLIAFLGGPDKHMQEENVIEILKSKPQDRGHHVGGMQLCLRPWTMGREFLLKCKIGAQQYVLLRVTMTAVAIVTWACGVYGEGSLDPMTGYFWVTLVVNFSQIWALYVLVFFYHALREDLAPVKPLGKFLTVKGVVFFAWWQSVGINAGLSMHIVEPGSEMSTTEFAAFANDWIMCCEMFIAAVAFHYAYSYRDFYRYDKQQDLGIVAAAATYISAINSTANANDYIQEIEAAGAAMTAAVGPPRGELIFKLYKEEVNMKQRLTVTIVEARGLRESSLGGHSEPFCVVKLIDADGQPLTKLPGNRKVTKTVSRTVNPKWNEAISFGGPECDLTGVWGVLISIRSKRSLRDARLGTVLAGVQKLDLGTPVTVKLSLDNDPPKIVATEPQHRQGGVQTPVDQLVITFDEEVKAGRGFVHVRIAEAPDVPVASANVRVPENVIIKDRKIIVKLPPGAVAEPGTAYYVTINKGAFVDEAENEFPGYEDGSKWSFKTHGELREKLKHLVSSTMALPAVLGRLASEAPGAPGKASSFLLGGDRAASGLAASVSGAAGASSSASLSSESGAGHGTLAPPPPSPQRQPSPMHAYPPHSPAAPPAYPSFGATQLEPPVYPPMAGAPESPQPAAPVAAAAPAPQTASLELSPVAESPPHREPAAAAPEEAAAPAAPAPEAPAAPVPQQAPDQLVTSAESSRSLAAAAGADAEAGTEADTAATAVAIPAEKETAPPAAAEDTAPPTAAAAGASSSSSTDALPAAATGTGTAPAAAGNWNDLV